MTEKKYTLSVANTASPQDHLADHADLCGRVLPPQLITGAGHHGAGMVAHGGPGR